VRPTAWVLRFISDIAMSWGSVVVGLGRFDTSLGCPSQVGALERVPLCLGWNQGEVSTDEPFASKHALEVGPKQMASSRTKWLVASVAGVVIAAGAAYGYVHFWREHSTPADIILYGNVDIREADLAFNVAGRIESMRVEEGDKVDKGQLLATLEPQLYEAEVDAAKAQAAAQRATLDRLLAGSRPEEIKKARQNVRDLEAQLDFAQATLKRTQQLAMDKFAPFQKLDEDRARVTSLEAQLRAAKEELSLVIQGPREEDIAEARALLRAREADLALALRRLEYTKLFAKDRGVIRTRIVEPGAVVAANAPVYTVALLDPVWVRTYAPEPQLGRIQPGMSAQIFTDSAPGRAYDGWVGFISPVAEFTPKTVETPGLRTSLVYRLRVYVEDPDNSLRQGMPVTVRLTPGTAGHEGRNTAAP
jgi:HlyD family secretion protein